MSCFPRQQTTVVSIFAKVSFLYPELNGTVEKDYDF